MEDKETYIISFDKMPSCTYSENGEVYTLITFPSSLVPNAIWLKKEDTILINDKNYIIKERIDLIYYIVLKCKEDK